MADAPAFLVTKDAVKHDPALQAGARGARKLLVTDLYAAKERESISVEWLPPAEGDKCPVQVMADAEVAVSINTLPKIAITTKQVPRFTWSSKVKWSSRLIDATMRYNRVI